MGEGEDDEGSSKDDGNAKDCFFTAAAHMETLGTAAKRSGHTSRTRLDKHAGYEGEANDDKGNGERCHSLYLSIHRMEKRPQGQR